MPGNPYKEQRLCFKQIEKVLGTALKDFPEGLSKKDITKELILNYDVSPLAIKKFIKEYYIDEGIVIEKDGLLFSVEKEDKDDE